MLATICSVTCRASDDNKREPFFPAHFSAEYGIVRFDCDLHIPDSFDPYSFHATKVLAYLSADKNCVTDLYINGKEIVSTHSNDESVYLDFSDGSRLSYGKSFAFSSLQYKWYTRLGLWSVKEPTANPLSFATAEDCISLIAEETRKLGVKTDSFVYTWYSFNQEQLAKEQAWRKENNLLSDEHVRKDISEEDEVYLIGACQFDQTLPIFHEVMGLHWQFAMDDLANLPLQALVSTRGLESIHLHYWAYQYQNTDEIMKFCPFEKIAQTAAYKYNMLITQHTFIINNATLFQRIWLDETQQLCAHPMWRLTGVDEEGHTLLTLVDAISGEEIFIQ